MWINAVRGLLIVSHVYSQTTKRTSDVGTRHLIGSFGGWKGRGGLFSGSVKSGVVIEAEERRRLSSCIPHLRRGKGTCPLSSGHANSDAPDSVKQTLSRGKKGGGMALSVHLKKGTIIKRDFGLGIGYPSIVKYLEAI